MSQLHTSSSKHLLSPVQLDESTKAKTGEAESAFKPRTLLSYMKRFPIKRVVHLPNVTADPIKFDLVYNVSEGSEMPPGAASPLMAQFVLTGVDSTLAKYNTTGKWNNRMVWAVASKCPHVLPGLCLVKYRP